MTLKMNIEQISFLRRLNGWKTVQKREIVEPKILRLDFRPNEFIEGKIPIFTFLVMIMHGYLGILPIMKDNPFLKNFGQKSHSE